MPVQTDAGKITLENFKYLDFSIQYIDFVEAVNIALFNQGLFIRFTIAEECDARMINHCYDAGSIKIICLYTKYAILHTI